VVTTAAVAVVEESVEVAAAVEAVAAAVDAAVVAAVAPVLVAADVVTVTVAVDASSHEYTTYSPAVLVHWAGGDVTTPPVEQLVEPV